ncbi:MAG: NERD domain-containing protein [Lachnospiraceae bacterium]|nr:NERD domain-containing protein [Lachnospiraceae bacterium]
MSGYDFVDAEYGILGIECLIIAIIAGISKGSFKWGLAAFAIMVILYIIPFVGGVVSVILSFAEMMIVCDLLKEIVPESVVLVSALFAFIILLELHRRYISIGNEVLFGYSLAFAESLFASLVLWLEYKSIPLVCIVFIVLMIVIFVPALRRIGFAGLAVAAAGYTFVFFHEHLAIQYSIAASLIVLIYVSFQYHTAYEYLHYRREWSKEDKAKEVVNSDEIRYKQSSYYLSTHYEYKDLLEDAGKYGEYLVYENLREYEQSGAKFLFNCYLPREDLPREEDLTAEADVMMIGQGGIFVFESKNRKGWVFGSENDKNWTITLPIGYKQSLKYPLYNPIRQNDSHIKHLRKLIGNDIPVFSIIVFSDQCVLKKVKVSRDNTFVIQRKEVKTVVNALTEQSKYNLSLGQIDELYRKLYPFSQVSSEVKEKHIEDVKKIIENQKEVKNNNAKENSSVSLVCPRCGAPLEIKLSKKGETIGKKFYSCSTYPVCKYSRSIELDVQNTKDNK